MGLPHRTARRDPAGPRLAATRDGEGARQAQIEAANRRLREQDVQQFKAVT
jgi:hypothetical protein